MTEVEMGPNTSPETWRNQTLSDIFRASIKGVFFTTKSAYSVEKLSTSLKVPIFFFGPKKRRVRTRYLLGPKVMGTFRDWLSTRGAGVLMLRVHCVCPYSLCS